MDREEHIQDEWLSKVIEENLKEQQAIEEQNKILEAHWKRVNDPEYQEYVRKNYWLRGQ